MNLVKQVTKWLEDRKIFRSSKLSEMDSGFFRTRSAIERLFGDIERRIRRFWNGYIGKYSRGSMEQWLGSFAGFRNLMKDSKGILS